MSRLTNQVWRRGMLLVLTVIGVASAAPALAQAASITEFSNGLTSTPGSIAAGSDGNLWFTEDHALGRITPDGAITEYGVAQGLSAGSMLFGDIVLGPDGNLWFSDDGTPQGIGRITPAGTITEYGTADGLNPGAVPEGLVAGADGNVWFLDLGTTRAVGRITPSGTITEFGPTHGMDPMSQANDITAGPDGSLWFTDEGSPKAIGRVTTTGAAAGTITEFTDNLDPIDSFPVDITAGPDGNVWFTDALPAVGRVTPDGTITEHSMGLQTNADPDTITAGPDGNVWFADQYANQRAIGTITPSGSITEFDQGLNMKLPDDLTVGADGNLWVAQSDMSPDSLSVARVSPAGAITELSNPAVTSPGSDLDQIVAGPDGNLWFTDDGTAAIGKVSLQLAPTATTGAASAVTGSSATVAGSVNPLGAATTVTIQYGTTAALGSTASAGSLPASGDASTVSASLSKLPPGTVIFYRVVAVNPFGVVAGTVQSFKTVAGPPTPPPPAPREHVTKATFANQQITLSTPATQTCTAKTSTLRVTLSSTAIRGSRQAKLRFATGSFYLDKGVKHRRKQTKHLAHGKQKTVTVTVYTANTVARHVPVTVRLRLAGLGSRTHALNLTIAYKKTVITHHHKKTVTVTKKLSVKFRVC